MGEDEGWITPENYSKKIAEGNTMIPKKDNIEEEEEVEEKSTISLMTADYAMQNVATQVGMSLLSLDGQKIKEIRRFIWECYVCWKQYKIETTEVKLCKECGYNSLSKIAYSIDSQGQMILHRKKNWKPNQKILEWKEKKFEEQQKKKKNQKARRKKRTYYLT